MGLEPKVKEKTFKQMLWVSMISMTMMFAGLTSAYVISTKREDWVNFELPQAFYISTILIVLSSLSFYLAKRSLANRGRTTLFLVITLLLGIGFVFFQFQGFKQLIDAGLYFTGKESNVATSFLYVITMAHMAHIFGGIITLVVILINHLREKYTVENKLGLELGLIFWHFVDLLWIYLVMFFIYIN
jgi:cytochrome c oxidase subunit 3